MPESRLIKVANLRHTTDGIRCDRESALGNPFVLLSRDDMSSRIDCVTAYGFYLHLVANESLQPDEAIEQVKFRQKPGQRILIVAATVKPSRKSFIDELAAIEEKYWNRQPVILLCWCAPLPCHCDRLAAYLRWKYLL